MSGEDLAGFDYSIVVVTRNDDHGGNPFQRLRASIEILDRQLAGAVIRVEYIVVDWNPVKDRVGMEARLRSELNPTHLVVRCIEVPRAIHDSLEHSHTTPLFQFIAKNIGIRRSRGRFIIATNMDVVFSDAFVRRLSSSQFESGHTYRMDRLDTDRGILEAEDPIEYAWSNILREWKRGECVDAPVEVDRGAEGAEIVEAQRDIPSKELHLYACGDFTMLHRDDWFRLHGYPEYAASGMNIDSLFMVMAHYLGTTEVFLPRPSVCFHIEHDEGTGFTPAAAKLMRERVIASGLPWIEGAFVHDLGARFRTGELLRPYNDESWGYRDIDFTKRVRRGRLRRIPLRSEYQLPRPMGEEMCIDSTDHWFRRVMCVLRRGGD